jgi:hypothetical protein
VLGKPATCRVRQGHIHIVMLKSRMVAQTFGAVRRGHVVLKPASDAAVLVEVTKMCVRLERRLAEQELDGVPPALPKPKTPQTTTPKPTAPKSSSKRSAATRKPDKPKK